MRHALLLAVSSLLLSCNERPDGFSCLVDAPPTRQPRLICFHMQRDMDKNGNIKPDAKPEIRPIASISDLDKYTVFDPNSWAAVKAWIRHMREQARHLSAEIRTWLKATNQQ